ncbi:MAG: dihydroorotase [Deltaproteobacteria bacterium]|nr:dihydroorotase [Deltaproteobacteria bacterium]
MTDALTIRRPDDWHLHLRDGEMLALVAPYTARQFGRAIVMPNLVPPVTTVDAAKAYRERIRSAVGDARFEPLMTAYLTDQIDPDEVARGHEEGVLTACKLYPAGATTNSDRGVTDIAAIHPVLERMSAIGMPLLVHGEVVDADIDIFDREKVFLERVLAPTLERFPDLKVVLEHITTAEAVAFVQGAGPNVAATITAHHLRIDRNDILVGGIKPHSYCLPVAKRTRHKEALRALVTTGDSKFFLGTDSAPHARSAKENACGCAGIFSAPFAIESYAQTFDELGCLEKLEGFASLYGPAFYGLPANEETITLERGEQQVPERIDPEGFDLTPFHAGERLGWSLVG